MGDGKGKASDSKDLDIDGAGGQFHVTVALSLYRQASSPVKKNRRGKMLTVS